MEAAHPEIVELATLSLPSEAISGGLAVGEGNEVVLEASNETVQQIQKHQTQQIITGVVDLEVLGELVGASEEVIIAGLQHHGAEEEAREAEGAETSERIENDEEEEEEKSRIDETTPLMTNKKEQQEESSDAPDTMDQVALDADPFIQKLVDVLPPATESVFIGDDDEENNTQLGHVTEAGATTVIGGDQEQRFAHDAFLLNVPLANDEGNFENHYVIALPEIEVADSVMTEESMEGTPLLERAMSLLPTTTRLPTDIQSVHLEATEHIPDKTDPTTVHLEVVISRQVPVIGYIILLTGLFALSSVGAALDLQRGGVTPGMKTVWRQIATSVCILPMVGKSLHYDGLPELTKIEMLAIPLAASAYTYMTLAFVLALEMTTLANAFVLSNMTSLVIIAGRGVMGLPVLPAEGIGATTGFLGAAVCAADAARSTDVSVPASYSMLGNFVALSASFGMAGYLIIAKSLRRKMDLFLFMFCVMSIGAVLLVTFLFIHDTEPITFDMHPVHGVFGWLNLTPDRLPLELYMALVCNCLGTTGYIAVMKYFEPIVPATVMLLEPVIGALLGTAAGTAPLPGLQTWVGDIIVAAGTFLVIQAGAKKKPETIQATEALRTHNVDGQSPVVMRGPPTTNSTIASHRSVVSRTSSAISAAHSRPTVIWEK